MKFKNTLDESVIAFKKIDKIISQVFLYYAATCGFIFGWVVLGILFFTINNSIPLIYVVLLRVFYFLLSFLIGLKLTIFSIYVIKKVRI